MRNGTASANVAGLFLPQPQPVSDTSSPGEPSKRPGRRPARRGGGLVSGGPRRRWPGIYPRPACPLFGELGDELRRIDGAQAAGHVVPGDRVVPADGVVVAVLVERHGVVPDGDVRDAWSTGADGVQPGV